MKTLKVQMNGKPLIVADGSHIEELLPRAPHLGAFPPVGALINNRPEGLYFHIRSAAEITTIDLSRREGMDIYRRTTSALLCAAVAEVAPDARVTVGQSISDGYFYELHGHKLTAPFIEKLETKMREIAAADFPIELDWIPVEEAMEIFEKNGTLGSVKLLRQFRRFEMPMLTLCNYRGYAHGPVASRTGIITIFKLHPYEHGFVLEFPNDQGKLAKRLTPQPRLFGTYLEMKKWNAIIGVENVADLNEMCMSGGALDLIHVTEALHEKRIAAIADEIASRKHTRLVLIAGPSSSGKTTFSKRLGIHLKIHGLEPVTISMDNYYVDREATPKHPDGSFDFESIEALDIKLFNEHMQKLSQGEEVEVPKYSFPLAKRDPSKAKRMKLKKGQILMTEGIHGLNEVLTSAIPADSKFKVYVSALTQLCLDEHNRIFTTDTRLCRRIIRDRLFRGTTASETIAGWPSVRAGENKYIFPFQEDADVIFNSALPYEHALLKPYAERYLAEVPREHPSFVEAARLSRFFSLFLPILPLEVPQTSIIREFVGGSAFKYS